MDKAVEPSSSRGLEEVTASNRTTKAPESSTGLDLMACVVTYFVLSFSL